MKYSVELKQSVIKKLEKLPKSNRNTLIIKLKALQSFPKVSNVRKLSKPLNGYRLRVGDYRVLFIVNWQKNKIIVYFIDHRKDVYRI